MSIKQILAAIERRNTPDSVIRMAIGLAERFDATLVCLYAVIPVGGPRYAGGLTLATVMKEIAERDLAEASTIRAALESLAKQHGVRTEWRVARGFPDYEAVLHSRYSDLTIMSQPDLHPLPTSIPLRPDDVVMASGCPVIIVPRQAAFPASGRRILVAWNASREAIRAVNDALPLLKAADSVDIVLVNPGRGHEGACGHGQEPGADIAAHLARHGIRPEVHVEHMMDEAVGRRILMRAEQLGSELIVAGAYGYSRMRELVIGGVTQHLLDNARVPVFFSR